MQMRDPEMLLDTLMVVLRDICGADCWLAAWLGGPRVWGQAQERVTGLFLSPPDTQEIPIYQPAVLQVSKTTILQEQKD